MSLAISKPDAATKGPLVAPRSKPVKGGATWALGIIPFLVIIGAWWLYDVTQPQRTTVALPLLVDVGSALTTDLTSPAFYRNLWVTTSEFIYGLIIAVLGGVGFGVLVGLSRRADAVFYPFIMFFHSIPKMALAPLMVLIFGFGIGSKVAVAAAVSFFPILVGVMQGMRIIRHDELDLMRSVGASKRQIFQYVRLPRALPSAFGGFQVGALFALGGAVVTEFIAATEGIGYLLVIRTDNLDSPGVYSGIVVLSVLGVIVALGLSYAGKQLSRWEEQ